MNSCNRLDAEAKARLSCALAATAELLGQCLSESAIKFMVEDLADYPADAIAAALRECRKTLKGRLTVGAIVQCINDADGRPTRNEAWSIASKAHDERCSVLITHEVQQAMAASETLMRNGDEVGARMAFMETYERLVADARREARAAKWEISLGQDAAGREQAIEEGVRLGRISQDRAAAYLPHLGHAGSAQLALTDARVSRLEELSRAASPVLAMLPAPTAQACKAPEKGRPQLQALRELLTSSKNPGASA